MQEQAHLVGARPATRRAVGGQMGLPCLDMVLGLAAGAIDVLVDGAPGRAEQTGDDEACVGPLRPGFDTSDDALHTVPACRPVVELLEPPQLRPTRSGGRAGGSALLEVEDVSLGGEFSPEVAAENSPLCCVFGSWPR